MNFLFGGIIHRITFSPKSYSLPASLLTSISPLSTYEWAAPALLKDWGPNLFPSILHQSGPQRTDLGPQFLAFFYAPTFSSPLQADLHTHKHTLSHSRSFLLPHTLTFLDFFFLIEVFPFSTFFLKTFLWNVQITWNNKPSEDTYECSIRGLLACHPSNKRLWMAFITEQGLF